MMTFKKILCPIDFSESSYRALDEAIWWIESYERKNDKAEHAMLCLMNVLPEVYLWANDVNQRDSDFQERDEALSELHQIIKARVPAKLQRCVYPVVQRGNPSDEMATAVEVDGYDLVVMGTHGLTGWRHLVMGSITEAVVRQAACPVLTVRCEPGVGNVKQREIKKVMCPTDFSVPSYTAIPCAAVLASRFGAELQIIHVMEPLTPVLGIVSVEEFEMERSGEAAQALLNVIEKHVPLQMQDCAALNRIVRTGAPAEQIVLAAQEENTDLIVMATQGETGWRHLMFGSVAEEVVRTATCPVLTICKPEVIAVSPDLIEQSAAYE